MKKIVTLFLLGMLIGCTEKSTDPDLSELRAEIDALHLKVESLEAKVAINDAKMGISSEQASAIEANAALASSNKASLDSIGTHPAFDAWDKNAADDFDGDYVSLSQRPAPIPPELSELSTYLDVNTEEHLIVFNGANVQIQDGTGETSCENDEGNQADCNGLGNLIIGYNNHPGKSQEGSHNLIVGWAHTTSKEAYGGVVFGSGNQILAPGATVLGGSTNIASGYASSVSGGRVNVAASQYSVVSGGANNETTSSSEHLP